MIKNVLKGVAVVLAVSEIIALWFVFTLAEPYGRIPGGRLSGEEVTGPVTDLISTLKRPPLTLEVRPSNPYSVHTSYTVYEGNLYVSAIIGGDSRWARFLVEDPNLRIRSGNKIYKVRATKVEDQTLLDEIHEFRARRGGGGSTRTPEELARMWFFRIDSR
jgi:hypothetical protein